MNTKSARRPHESFPGSSALRYLFRDPIVKKPCSKKNNFCRGDDGGGDEVGAGELFFSGITACAVNMVERLANTDSIDLDWMDVGVESYRDSDADHGDLTLYDAIRIKFEMWGVDEEDAQNLVETWKKR